MHSRNNQVQHLGKGSDLVAAHKLLCNQGCHPTVGPVVTLMQLLNLLRGCGFTPGILQPGYPFKLMKHLI